MAWPDGKKRGSMPKHLWDLHTDICKKCGMPRYGVREFPEQFYGCSVNRSEYKQRLVQQTPAPMDAAAKAALYQDREEQYLPGSPPQQSGNPI